MPLLTTTARRRCRSALAETCTGAATTALRVNSAAGCPRPSRRQARRGRARRTPSCRRRARGAEAARQPARRGLGRARRRVDPARAEEGAVGPLIAGPRPRRGPASGSGSAPPGRPRPSRGCRSRRRRARVPRSGGRVDTADVRVAHVAHARRRCGQLDELLVARRRPRKLRELVAASLARGRHVTARPAALVERQQVRHERHAGRRRRAPPAPGRSRARGGARRPRSALDVLVDRHEVRALVRVAARRPTRRSSRRRRRRR